MVGALWSIQILKKYQALACALCVIWLDIDTFSSTQQSKPHMKILLEFFNAILVIHAPTYLTVRINQTSKPPLPLSLPIFTINFLRYSYNAQDNFSHSRIIADGLDLIIPHMLKFNMKLSWDCTYISKLGLLKIIYDWGKLVFGSPKLIRWVLK